MNRQRFLLPALLALTVARFIFISVPELSAVERHALDCSQHEGLWQPAMGPMLPLLMKASTAVFGVNPFGVRFLAPLLILGAGCLLWMLMRGMFDAITASWALVIFQVTPAVNLAAVTMTLTTLGIVMSVALLLALRHALHRDLRWYLQWWTLAVALILSIFIDWRLFMLAVSCVAVMALTTRGRRALLKWPVLPILGLSTGLAGTFFLAWNSEHGWPAFAPFPGMVPPTLWQLTAHVLLAISPLLLVGYGWSLVKSVTRQPMEYVVAFLYAFAWPLVSLDVLSWMLLPWPQCGYGAWIAPAVMLLAYHTMSAERTPTRKVMLLRWLVVAAAAVQSCVMMQRGLDSMHVLPW